MNSPTNTDVIIKRIINAPVETVWELWTDPTKIVKWWGPADYTSPSAQVELKVGGKFLFCMQAPEYQGGHKNFTGGEYTEIVPQKKLGFTQYLADSQGNKLPLADLPDDFPETVVTTVTFNEINGMTELEIIERNWKLSTMSVFAYAGMHQSLDNMANWLIKQE